MTAAPPASSPSAALNEIARAASVPVELDESALAVPDTVAAACDLLGLAPRTVANEGCLVAFVAFVAPEAGEAAPAVVEIPLGEQLPRVC
ncbi:MULTISPECIES: hypothetical protein [unclassified Streptomyces]|uniref:hypothetical protein n=1 Tax=unclassified Streptomyces TaxID=2593676 RepID=UPI00278BDBD2|nr:MULTISPECIES: hypothetical protein [unclassified Streptomyces]